MASIKIIFDTGSRCHSHKVQDTICTGLRRRSNILVVRVPPKTEKPVYQRPEQTDIIDNILCTLNKFADRIDSINDSMVNGSQRQSSYGIRSLKNTVADAVTYADDWSAMFEADIIEETKLRKE
ncbi:MAG: hypothetical protein STHCBS139747_005012 [Sporothrix thermara]